MANPKATELFELAYANVEKIAQHSGSGDPFPGPVFHELAKVVYYVGAAICEQLAEEQSREDTEDG